MNEEEADEEDERPPIDWPPTDPYSEMIFS